MATGNRTEQVLVQIGAAVDRSFDRSIGRATSRLRDLGQTQERLNQIQQQKSALRGQMMDAVGLVASIGSVVVAATRFESVMADVGKQTNLTGGALDEMGRSIRRVARDSPMAAGEIATMMAEAGKAGVANDQLMGFAKSAEQIATAWEMPAAQVGETLATWRVAFGMSEDRASQLADRINYLGDNLATTPAKIAGVVTRLGGMARSAGLSEDALAAMTATMNASGTPIDQTRTAMKNLIARMQSGESATKAQQEAFAALGFDAKTMASAMQDDAQGAIMSVLRALRDAPGERRGSLVKQLFGLESLAGIQGLVGNLDQADQAIHDITQTEKAAGTVADEYARKLETMGAQAQILWGRITDLGVTIGNALLPTLKTGAQVIGSVVGGVVTLAEKVPLLTSVVTHAAAGLITFKVASLGVRYASLLMRGSVLSSHLAVGRLVQGLAGVPVSADAASQGMHTAGGAVRRLGGRFAGLAARVPGLRGAMAGVAMQATLVGQSMAETPGIIGKARVALLAGAGAFKALGVAIMTTPVGWIAGGIALVGAAIYKWWEPLTNWLGGFWDGLSSTFGRVGAAVQTAYDAMGPLKPVIYAVTTPARLLWTAISGIGSAVGWLVGQLGSLFSPVEQTGAEAKATAAFGAELGRVIGTVLVGAVNAVTWPLRKLGDLIGWISDVTAPGRALIETFAGGIGAAASALYDKVAGVLSTVRDYLPFSDARRGPLSNLTGSGRGLIVTLAAGIAGAGGALVSTVTHAVGRIPQAIASIGGKLRDAGSEIIGTVVDGISANANAIKDKMSSVLSGVRDYLPFSDAKRGPMSDLTRSGRSIPGTIAQGVRSNEGALTKATDRMAGAAAARAGRTAEVAIRPRMMGLGGLPGTGAPSTPVKDAQTAVQRAAGPGGARSGPTPSVAGDTPTTPASGGRTINASVTVNVQGGDPDEIARRVRAEIEAMEDDQAFARRAAFND